MGGNGKDIEGNIVCKSCQGELFEQIRCFTFAKVMKTEEEGTIEPDKIFIALRCANCCAFVMEPALVGRVKKQGDIITPEDLRKQKSVPNFKLPLS